MCELIIVCAFEELISFFLVIGLTGNLDFGCSCAIVTLSFFVYYYVFLFVVTFGRFGIVGQKRC